jgi:hypothetical protein
MAESDINTVWKFVTIGRGSFASVSVLTGRPVAFKHVILRESAVELKAEFEALRSLYDCCETDSFFGIPRPLAFYDPHQLNSFLLVGGSPPSELRRRPRRSLVTEGDFRLLELDTAAYAMDQVLPIPLLTAKIIRTLFYPPNTPNASGPMLCRLYFGKVIQEVAPGGRPNRFFNSANFPLDVSRYRKMLDVAVDGDCEYPSVEDIAYGMGEMLGRLHWHAGYDGRDVEFVMGGASFSGVTMYTIDFNQVCYESFSSVVGTITMFLRCVYGKGIRRTFNNSSTPFTRMTHIILARILTTCCTRSSVMVI